MAHDTANCQYCNYYRRNNLPIPAVHIKERLYLPLTLSDGNTCLAGEDGCDCAVKAGWVGKR